MSEYGDIAAEPCPEGFGLSASDCGVGLGTCSDCQLRDATPNADDGLCSECAAVTP